MAKRIVSVHVRATISSMRGDLESQSGRTPVLRKAVAGLVLLAVAALAVHAVIGLVLAVFWVVVVIAAIAAVLWALNTLL
jgi:hypothetical protein